MHVSVKPLELNTTFDSYDELKESVAHSGPLMYLEIVLKNMTSYRNNLILDKYVHFTLF
jgi:hypothetical protein